MQKSYTNVMITGVGGLGNILLTRLTGMALYQRHPRVITSEERGIAQRTGSVSAVLRAGRDIETSCLYSQQTAYLLGLEPLEALRKLPFCQRGTLTFATEAEQIAGTITDKASNPAGVSAQITQPVCAKSAALPPSSLR